MSPLTSRRPRPFPSLLALFGLLLLFVPAAPLVAQDEGEDLGFFESRNLLSRADELLAAGNAVGAEQLYEQVIAGVGEGTKRRARALLGAALAELSREAAVRDVDAARQHLRDYSSAAEAERDVTVRVLLGLLGTPEPEAESAPSPPPPPRAEPSGPTEADIASLRARIADLEARLEQKNDLIEELRKIVVEGGG